MRPVQGNGNDAERPAKATLDVELRHLNQIDLSRRWRMSPRTLERWRCERVGPVWLRVRGKVLYRLEDILAYEREGLQAPDPAPPPRQP